MLFFIYKKPHPITFAFVLTLAEAFYQSIRPRQIILVVSGARLTWNADLERSFDADGSSLNTSSSALP